MNILEYSNILIAAIAAIVAIIGIWFNYKGRIESRSRVVVDHPKFVMIKYYSEKIDKWLLAGLFHIDISNQGGRATSIVSIESFDTPPSRFINALRFILRKVQLSVSVPALIVLGPDSEIILDPDISFSIFLLNDLPLHFSDDVGVLDITKSEIVEILEKKHVGKYVNLHSMAINIDPGYSEHIVLCVIFDCFLPGPNCYVNNNYHEILYAFKINFNNSESFVHRHAITILADDSGTDA